MIKFILTILFILLILVIAFIPCACKVSSECSRIEEELEKEKE